MIRHISQLSGKEIYRKVGVVFGHIVMTNMWENNIDLHIYVYIPSQFDMIDVFVLEIDCDKEHRKRKCSRYLSLDSSKSEHILDCIIYLDVSLYQI